MIAIIAFYILVWALIVDFWWFFCGTPVSGEKALMWPLDLVKFLYKKVAS